MLAFANFDKPFLLETVASKLGLGAVLSQKHPVAYASWSLTIHEQHEQDNAAADALSWVTLKLDAETVKSILDGVTMEMMERSDTQTPVVARADEELHRQVQETVILAWVAQAHINLHVADWVTTQQEDPILNTTIKWISGQKLQDLKHLLGDNANTGEGKTILWEQNKLMHYQGALYHFHTPAGDLEKLCNS